MEGLKGAFQIDAAIRINSLIIKFEDLPDEQKFNFDWYRKREAYSSILPSVQDL